MAVAENDSNEDNFQLTQKELEELDNIRLSIGLSDSEVEMVKGRDTGNYKIRRKRGDGPPPPVHRDAMGKYIVPAGGKPLTKNEWIGPSPATYDPNYDKISSNAPMYSLGEPFDRRVRRKVPGPKYNLQGDLAWKKCKRITIKSNNPVKIPNPGPGPAGYQLPSTIGKGKKGPQITMKQRAKSSQVQGFISSLVRQADPANPGPGYAIVSDWNKPVSFGIKPKKGKKKTWPAPNRYNVRGEPEGPKWKLGEKTTPLDVFKGGPGPGAYSVPGMMGDAPHAVVIANRRMPKFGSRVPGPDTYHRAGYDLSEPGYTMKYRWFPEEIESRPGPADYSPGETTKKPPSYSLGIKNKPTYPSSVYANITNSAPAPNSYGPPESTKNRGKSFGTARRPVVDTIPGPADYTKTSALLPQQPAYSFGRKPVKKQSTFRLPGPAAYRLKDPPLKPRSIGVRIDTSKSSVGPGPAGYTPCTGPCSVCESATGVTLKSRHTPHKYTGLKTQGPLMPTNRAAADCPLFG